MTVSAQVIADGLGKIAPLDKYAVRKVLRTILNETFLDD